MNSLFYIKLQKIILQCMRALYPDPYPRVFGLGFLRWVNEMEKKKPCG